MCHCCLLECKNNKNNKNRETEIISTFGFNNTDIIVNEDFFFVSLYTLIFEKQ